VLKQEDSEQDLEPKIRQRVAIIGRTIECSRCTAEIEIDSLDGDGKRKKKKVKTVRDVAAIYCACGSFLCAFHAFSHKCIVSSSLEYDKELLAALT
jgi:hypothetical protein